MSNSNRVLVLSNTKKPLMPCNPARARILLRDGKAAVYKHYPFTIILKYRDDGDVQGIHMGIDPGTKFTGLALVAMFKQGSRCIYGQHIQHRGHAIRQLMKKRANVRRSRRSRKLRYRPVRFNNRARSPDWVPPSIKSRVCNIETWSLRLSKSTPITQINFEVTHFDTNILANVSEAQLNTDLRIRTKMRHYLLHLYNGTCQYCSTTVGPMEWEHIIPKSRGGTNALSNSTLSCRLCNQLKDNLQLEEWLKVLELRPKAPGNPERIKGIKQVMNGVKTRTRDASIMNWTRYLICDSLKTKGFEVKEFPAWETAYNRKHGAHGTHGKLPKEHWVDAACVGNSDIFINSNMQIYTAKARQNNARQMQSMDRFGFPRTSPKGPSRAFGFKSGDTVRLNQIKGKYKGTYVGPITIKSSGHHSLKTILGEIASKYSNYKLLQRTDGYGYIEGIGYTKTLKIIEVKN